MLTQRQWICLGALVLAIAVLLALASLGYANSTILILD
jgi:hypothetical protein